MRPPPPPSGRGPGKGGDRHEIFLDTANLDEIRQGVSFGVIDGITTNPTLVAKEKRPFREHVIEICNIVKNGEISAEVVSTDTAGILREAREIATWHPNVIVKIPTIPDGVRALSILSKEDIRVNMTLVFSAPQALIVAKAGAYFVSPFLGRLDDIASDGLTLLREIMDIYKAYNYPTQVLAASLRHPLHVVAAARMGAHIGTMPYKVFEQLFKHPLTDRGLEGFLKDWEKARETMGDVFRARCRAQSERVEALGNRLADRCGSRGGGRGRCRRGLAAQFSESRKTRKTKSAAAVFN